MNTDMQNKLNVLMAAAALRRETAPAKPTPQEMARKTARRMMAKRILKNA